MHCCQRRRGTTAAAVSHGTTFALHQEIFGRKFRPLFFSPRTTTINRQSRPVGEKEEKRKRKAEKDRPTTGAGGAAGRIPSRNRC